MNLPDWFKAALGVTGLNVLLAVLCKRWVEAWIDERYAQKLEALKSQLSVLSNRLSKIHEWDFQTLMEAWKLMQEARGHFHALISSFRQYPALDSMPDEFLREYVERDLKDWYGWERNQLLTLPASEKQTFFAKQQRWREVGSSRSAFVKFQHFVIDNEPILGEVAEPMTKITDAMLSTLIQAEMNADALKRGVAPDRDYKEWKTINPLVTEVRDMIRKRLLAEAKE